MPMLKSLFKILLAGVIGVISMFAVSYLLWLRHDDWLLPIGSSNTRLIAVMFAPIPIGLLIARVAYHVLDRIIGDGIRPSR